jgi:hypothetical protein
VYLLRAKVVAELDFHKNMRGKDNFHLGRKIDKRGVKLIYEIQKST